MDEVLRTSVMKDALLIQQSYVGDIVINVACVCRRGNVGCERLADTAKQIFGKKGVGRKRIIARCPRRGLRRVARSYATAVCLGSGTRHNTRNQCEGTANKKGRKKGHASE